MRAALSLGSNVGDREAHLRTAIDALRTVTAVSSLHETDPVGGPPQGLFLNAAVVLETDLSPRALLEWTRALEDRAGRARDVRWGPRTLDIDLLLCDDMTIEEPQLTIPHPRLAERAFVLEPLAEIVPDWIVPGRMCTVEQLLEDLPIRR